MFCTVPSTNLGKTICTITSWEAAYLALSYEKKFMLNSAEHESFPLINVKMPILVGILTIISRKNSNIGLSEHENAELLDILSL